MRVAFFMGCATDFVYPDLGLKLIDFLTKHSVEVVVPETQNCCGAAIYFSGDLVTGRILADKNIKAFKDPSMSTISSPHAGPALPPSRTTRSIFPTLRQQKDRYEEFETKIKDSTEFVIDVMKIPPEDFKLRKEFEGKTATWHDPCHLIRYQNIKDQPSAILKSLKGLNYVEMANADICCGMGGSFSVYHYDLTKKIAPRKRWMASQQLKPILSSLPVRGV